MNYIYDVVANFTNPIIDLFDWNRSDEIIHLKKVPIIKVSSETLYDFLYSTVKVREEFLELIKGKCDPYNRKDLEYVVILTDSKISLCTKFKNAINVGKSFLWYDEEEEIEDISYKMNTMNLIYNKIDSNHKIEFKTRKQRLAENYVIKNINSLKRNNDTEKLKYIYYDCFNEECEDVNFIIDKITKEIETVAPKISNFLKLISIRNN